MTVINKKMSLEQFAFFVANMLKQNNIDVILVGGAVVSIYTNNKYESHDLDFLSLAEHSKIRESMVKAGFTEKGKNFYHPNSEFSVEFPGRELIIGVSPTIAEGQIVKNNFTLKLLSPSQCIMDRLAAYYHWDDRQSLEQALLVAENHPFDFSKIKKWSEKEGALEKFKVFSDQLNSVKK